LRFLAFVPADDYILSAKVKVSFNAKWDAGALMVWADDPHLWDLSAKIYPHDSPAQRRWVMVRKDKLDDGKIEAFIRLLRAAAAAHPDLADEIGAEINYFETNKERMRYPEFRDQRNQSVSVFVSAVYIARLGPLGSNHQRPSSASKAKQLLEDPTNRTVRRILDFLSTVRRPARGQRHRERRYFLRSVTAC
jgi:hypothetical protein